MKLTHAAFLALIGGLLILTIVTAWPAGDGPTSTDIAAGKLLHEETAGDVGCASCHGMNAKGEGLAPDIRGADVERITDSLMNTGDMADIKLTPAQIKQLAAFLHTIAPKVSN
jgi:mono/diheme cytochrome c family protein